MSNQNYIDYENSIAAQNTTVIVAMTQSNSNLDLNITQIQTQIADNTAQITQLLVYNTYIVAIIEFLTDAAIIAYQNSISTHNTASIAQLTQANVNLNQNITQFQTIIANNIAEIGVLQTHNTYIAETIALIPV